MKVVRYFHIRHLNASKGGATVRVEGEDNCGPEGLVHVSWASCSPMDPFQRQLGRQTANDNAVNLLGKKQMVIPLKGLPGMLHKRAVSVLKRTKNNVGVPRRSTELFQRDFSFATKYWCKPEKKETESIVDVPFEAAAPKLFGAARHEMFEGHNRA